jgi:hypothetical protein
VTTAYPAGLDAFTNPSGVSNLNDAPVLHSAAHSNLNDAVEAIEAELGLLPKGGSASVRARLDGIDTALAARALSSRTISAGTGLTGGGDLTASRTLAVDLEYLQDQVAAMLTAGTNVTLSYNDATGALTINATGGGGSPAAGSVHFIAKRVATSTSLASSTWTTYPLEVIDTNVGGGTYNTSTYIYTVPSTGLYLCLGSIRISDNTATRDLALGIGTSNADGPHVQWANIGFVGSGGRDVRQYTRSARYTAGDQVRMFIYSDGATFPTQYDPAVSSAQGQSMTLIKLAD